MRIYPKGVGRPWQLYSLRETPTRPTHWGGGNVPFAQGAKVLFRGQINDIRDHWNLSERFDTYPYTPTSSTMCLLFSAFTVTL